MKVIIIILNWILKQLINYMVPELDSAADSNSADQEITCCYDQMVHYRHHKSPQFILSWATSIQFTPSQPIPIPISVLFSHTDLGLKVVSPHKVSQPASYVTDSTKIYWNGKGKLQETNLISHAFWI
jgi:hypothetical protein